MTPRFQKILIADERYESCGVFDVNNDGVLDIVSGALLVSRPEVRPQVQDRPGPGRGRVLRRLLHHPDGRQRRRLHGLRHRRLVGQHHPLAREPQGRPGQALARARHRRGRQRRDHPRLGRRRRRPDSRSSPTPPAARSGSTSSSPTQRRARASSSEYVISDGKQRATASASATSTATAGATSSWPRAGSRPPRIPSRASGSATRSSTWAAPASRSWSST